MNLVCCLIDLCNLEPGLLSDDLCNLEPGLLSDLERRVTAAEAKFLEANLELKLDQLEKAKQKQVHQNLNAILDPREGHLEKIHLFYLYRQVFEK